MPSITPDKSQTPHHRRDEYPSLASLRLTAADWEELAHQGFVSEERRGRRKYYKLRFRSGGKQVVRYIGSADRAATVHRELKILQAETKVVRELKARAKIANKMLRESKLAMEPVLENAGLAFHGLAIRRPRKRRPATRSQANS